MKHAKLIRSHYIILVESIDCDCLLGHLWADEVISYVEREDISSGITSVHQTQKLLSLIAMKPADLFARFVRALTITGQDHVSKILTENSVAGKYVLQWSL